MAQPPTAAPPPHARAPAGATVLDLIALFAVRQPAAPALEAPGGPSISYSGLARLVDRGSRLLGSRHVPDGARVCVAMPQGLDAVVALLSVMGRSSALPLSPGLTRPEYLARFRTLRPDVLVVAADAPGEAPEAALGLGIPVLSWSESLDPGPGNAECGMPRPAARALAVVLPTSGTTGEPRRVPLTHANLFASARHIGAALALTPADRFLDVAALHHVAGLGLVLASLSAGSSTFVTPGFRNAEFVDWVRAYRATWTWLAPTMLAEVLRRDPEGLRAAARLGPLRLVRSGAMPLPGALLESAERVLGVPVLETYGMTEAAPQITSSPLPPLPRKPGSAGVAAGPALRIARADGTTAAAGEPGEIQVAGPSVMGGYEDDPAANVAAFEQGWFKTGDIGHLDEEGYLYVSGRQKEIIRCGGETISPREVEEALLGHPAVADAVAFPVPDDRLSQVVGAAIVPAGGAPLDERMLRRFLSARLTGHKMPVRIVSVAAVPRTAGGKVARVAMAETLGLLAATQPAPPEGAQHVAPATPIELALEDMWRRRLDCARVGVHDSFFALGGDSFGMTELLAEVEQRFGADGQALEMAFCQEPTIAALARAVAQGEERSAATVHARGVIEVRRPGTPTNEQAPPLFVIPLAGGNGYYLVPLATRIAATRAFYILDAEELGRGDEPSIERLAARCVEAIRRLHPAGPYLLAGHCFGGVVAYECARQLVTAGGRVTLVALLDTPTPGFPQPLRDFSLFVRAARFHLARAAADDGSLRAAASAVRDLAHHARRLVQGRVERVVPALGTPDSTRMLWRYQPGPYVGPVAQLIARDHAQTGTPLDRRLGWRRLVRGPFDVSLIEGTHFTVFDERHVGAVAEFLTRSIVARLTLEGRRPALVGPEPAARERYSVSPGDAA